MRYLCLIHLNEQEFEALPAATVNDLNVRHLALNESLRQSGHFIEAEALESSRETATVRPRRGKVTVTDGPFTEAKEIVAGFYLIEARDRDEAISIAAQLPGGAHGAVEVRPCRQLLVDESLS
jgi:hypothetical protein